MIAYLIAIAFFLGSMLIAISVGTVQVPLLDTIQILAGQLFRLSFNDIDPMYTNIVTNIRLPRVILAGLVGASLAIAGAAFQGL